MAESRNHPPPAKGSKQDHLPVAHARLPDGLTDQKGMGAELVGDFVDQLTFFTPSTCPLLFSGAEILAPDRDRINQHPVEGMQIRGHRNLPFLAASGSRAGISRSTVGAAFANGAALTGAGISQVPASIPKWENSQCARRNKVPHNLVGCVGVLWKLEQPYTRYCAKHVGAHRPDGQEVPFPQAFPRGFPITAALEVPKKIP
ncbi:hypothetical protein XINFAN_02017 [Pseudogemmobacter humi]|uniref:Uncharacterized protein n=1 Tax=Pseudogemmobacter humi TaxID=2483812 RepID=A0A3P5XBK4_9RHOB|nr:hypothetical protein XINFAN_02017 [Pseudogemmobacter humi]